MLYRGLVFDAMVESESHANVALTKTFANAVWPGTPSSSSAPARSIAPRSPAQPEIAALEHELRRLADGLPWSRSRSTT